MDDLIANQLGSGPALIQAICALEGAYEILANLLTDESKVAYIIWLVSYMIFKADEALCEKSGKSVSKDLLYHSAKVKDFFAQYPYDISTTDLGHFQDLYYASYALIADSAQQVHILLSNGFKTPDTIHFKFSDALLASAESVRLGPFQDFLETLQRLLLGDPLITILGLAVSNLAIQRRDSLQNSIGDVHELAHTPEWPSTPKTMDSDAHSEHMVLYANFGISEHLLDVSSMSSAMISALLAEKHRNVHRGLAILPARQSSKSSRFRLSDNAPTYISPYNLDERAKRLQAPNKAQLPCICDPDCVCAPLCAADLTKDCLCEENSLFVQITEGMDIDDLAVPDLHRLARPTSHASSPTSERDLNVDSDSVSYDPRFAATENSSMQTKSTKMQSSFPQTCDIRSSCNQGTRYSCLSDRDVGQWNLLSSFGQMPMSSLDLVRPMAEQCDTPPMRSLAQSKIARRLFGKRKSQWLF